MLVSLVWFLHLSFQLLFVSLDLCYLLISTDFQGLNSYHIVSRSPWVFYTFTIHPQIVAHCAIVFHLFPEYIYNFCH